ncbi:MAG TPA: NfeD family protein [Rhodocyclaceae bacterium]|nr:NfeD family protein [Rhodocyclaceae bacterium]
MQIEWWHWLVGGIALLLCELALPAFVLVWFGLSALAVGVLLVVLPDIGITAQLVLWLVLSIALVALWFRVFKPEQYKTRIGMSDANVIGEVGLLAKPVSPFGKGEVRFQKPLLGSEVWVCVADEAIPVGERVRIVSVEGSLLKIARI